MKIETARLVLRPLRTEDLDAVHRYAADAAVTRYMLWGPNTLAETAEFVERAAVEMEREIPACFEFGIHLDGRLIGGIGFYPDDRRETAEIGWISLPEVWGRGYMTEAAAAVRDFAFGTVGLKRLTAHCDTRNIGSWRVMEKIGMTRQGIKKGARKDKKTGAYVYDEYTYKIEAKEDEMPWDGFGD